MNRWSALAVLLALAGALALRAPKLDTRPLHHDEAVNAVKVTELWLQGRYAYDPHEYHGPTLHYFTLPFLWLSGARHSDQLPDAALRVAPVVFGVGLILLLLLLADGLGRSAILWSAIFTAVSPAMVFYSRYFIHEMLLIFFTALLIGACWRYVKTSRARWAVMAGMALGLMFATKETFVITLIALVLAMIATAVWNRLKPGGLSAPWPPADAQPLVVPTDERPGWKLPKWQHVGLGMLAAGAVWFLFFTSFLTHFGGLADSFLTYVPWIKRAGGQSPHIHPWSFYLERLAWFHPVKGPAWSEALILGLAFVGAVRSLFGRASVLHRFLAFYTLALTTGYCLISYKTPWCLLNFYLGMLLLAGVGATSVVELFPARIARGAALGILAALTLHLAWQGWRAGFKYAADRRNPYVYAQTVPDLLNLVKKAEDVARVAPAKYEAVVKVIAPQGDYWPLPWYLRRFKHIGWYEQMPDDPYAPFVVVSTKLDARLDEKSEKKWIMAGISELRPGNFLELYVEFELWKRYVESRPRVPEPE